MIKSLTLFGSIFIIFLSIQFNKVQPTMGHPIKSALPQIQQQIKTDLLQLQQDAAQLEKIINDNNFSEPFTPEQIAAYYKLRNSFKTIAFVIEYWDKQFYDQRMNGAPLPKLTPKDTSIRIIEPKGLQVMDEIMFGEFTATSKLEFLKLIQLFNADLVKFNKTFHVQKINQRHIFEALRYNIIRQATLSITGFDTPASLVGLTDCLAELKSNHTYISFFEDELKFAHEANLFNQTDLTYSKAIQFIEQNPNFDTFDRLTFIKEFTNPLYKNIKDIHLALNYETWDETPKKFTHSLDYQGENLFDKNFMDPFAFVSQQNDSLFDKRVALGRLLFYDPLLSNNNKLACVSCHHPDKAFTDGRAKSLAADGKSHLSRNAMALPYSVYAQKMFWDVRVEGLENQFEHVVTNELEFHTAYAEIVNKLKQSEAYRNLFSQAYKQPNAITTNAIDYALSAYVMTLGDYTTQFDKFMRNENGLSQEAKHGFNLFAGKAACATCHFIPTFSGLVPPFFTESESEVLGVSSTENEPWVLDEDLGRFAGLIKESADFYRHSMKTVTVRNIEKTSPYMHNGAFSSLESVMDFYNDGGGAGRGLEVSDQTLSPDALNLTEKEIQDIITFMKSLNDENLPQAPSHDELPRDFKYDSWNKRVIPIE